MWFSGKLSNLVSCNWAFKEPIIESLKYKMAEIRHLQNRHDVIFSAEGRPIWIKCRRLLQNDMSTAVMWSKSKPGVEFQYGGLLCEFSGMSSQSTCHTAGCCHLANSMSWFQSYVSHCRVLPPGEFSGMSSQNHVSHCRVLPLGEFTVTIPEPCATLQGAVTWRNQCHDRATLQGVRIPSAILKIVFRHILFIFLKCNLSFDKQRLPCHLRYTCYMCRGSEIVVGSYLILNLGPLFYSLILGVSYL